MANRCKEGLIMDPFTVSRDDEMGCVCVSHKLKDITVVALVLRVVQTQAVLFLKSMSERVRSDIQRRLN